MSDYQRGEDTELEPDAAEVLQVETDPDDRIPCLPVVVEGPVRTQALPRKRASGVMRTIKQTEPMQILTEDPFRAEARIFSHDEAIYIGFDEFDFEGLARVILWPALTPFSITARTDVWVQSAGATEADVTALAIYLEHWAEG